MAVVPCGTGNDFAKTLGLTRFGPASIAALVESNRPAQIDVGWADGTYFLNSCGFGFDASVLEASYSVKLLKGDAVYIYSALRQLFTYKGVDVQPSGLTAIPRSRMLMITASNGRYLGGAFKIAPHASVLDGKLDVCFFGDSNIVNRVRLFVGAMRGTHLHMPGVSAVTADHFTLSFSDAPALEMDGELRIATGRSVELKCFRRALSVIAAPGAIV